PRGMLPIGGDFHSLLCATMCSAKNSFMHLVVNWLSERGEYSKAAGSYLNGSKFRAAIQFLFSDFHFLALQLHDGNCFPAMLLGLKRMFLDQRVRSEKRSNAFAKSAGSVSVNDPDARLIRQSGVIQEFVQ